MTQLPGLAYGGNSLADRLGGWPDPAYTLREKPKPKPKLSLTAEQAREMRAILRRMTDDQLQVLAKVDDHAGRMARRIYHARLYPAR